MDSLVDIQDIAASNVQLWCLLGCWPQEAAEHMAELPGTRDGITPYFQKISLFMICDHLFTLATRMRT